jgi:hypothetical protein
MGRGGQFTYSSTVTVHKESEIQVINGDFSRKEGSMYLVLTSGELEHSAIKETLLFPSMASRSISVATSNSSFTNREV